MSTWFVCMNGSCTVCKMKIGKTYQICVYCHGNFHYKCSQISENKVFHNLNHTCSTYFRNYACNIFPFSRVDQNDKLECFGKDVTLQGNNNSLCEELNSYPFTCSKKMIY